MNPDQVKEILTRIKKMSIAVFGDYCLDAYWMLAPGGGEVSIETGIKAEAVRVQRYSPGGAGNIVANLSALGPGEIRAIGVVGDDLFGVQLKKILENLGVQTTYLITQREDFQTYTYCKRYIFNQEQVRIDFGGFNQKSPETEEKLLAGLENAFKTCDILIFNQQVRGSISNPAFFDAVNELIQHYPERIVLVDSRHYGARFLHVYRKINQYEAARLAGKAVTSSRPLERQALEEVAGRLYQGSHLPVFITRGARGVLVADSAGIHEIPGIQICKPIDIVGAGDTFLSALAGALVGGASPAEAAEFANFAAAVTVQKLRQTGTASPREILQIAYEPDYAFQPELADDPRRARFLDNTRIEICAELHPFPPLKIIHALFDHDGTLSTLRQNWEQVMETVLLQAILGEALDTMENSLLSSIKQLVREYINKAGGLQTLLQMEDLLSAMKDFEFFPQFRIRNASHYKSICQKAVSRHIRNRIQGLQQGKVGSQSFMIRGASQFLQDLSHRGVVLYLISSGDQKEVEEEARLLGYARFFTGGIYAAGSGGEPHAKRKLIPQIVRDNKLGEYEFVCFGDGPEEMRACRKAGGLAIGVASDETRGFGLDTKKRTRLIQAGAHFIIPDFSPGRKLLRILLG